MLTNATIPQLIQDAIRLYQAGQLSRAGQLCDLVLQQVPRECNTLHLRGVIHYMEGNYDAAVNWVGKAIAANPRMPDYYNTLGNVLRAQGARDMAIEQYRKALSIAPEHPVALNNFANVLVEEGQYEAAVQCYREALALKADYAEAWLGLGNALHQQGMPDAAADSLGRALSIRPDYPMAHILLAEVLRRTAGLNDVITHYRKAVTLCPCSPDVLNGLGNALKDSRNYDEAVDCFTRAIRLKPGSAELHNNLGNTLKDQGRIGEAITHLKRALELKPDFAEALNNLGNAFLEQGRLREAIACYQKALRLWPEDAGTYSNYLYAINYDPDHDPTEVYAEHLRFAERHEAPLAKYIKSHHNTCDQSRRLRIGYVSPDFCGHSVAYFLEPVLASHDQDQFEIYCYYNNVVEDDVTRRLQGYASHWRVIAGVPDEQVTRIIREDKIDILVDLAGHTAMNRLLVFARKPAPVQATWVGYLNTTGLTAMDYRITDRFACPPGKYERLHTEELLLLPVVQGCYRPPPESPAIGPSPCIDSGYVTFGSFNNLAKVTPHVIRCWSEILKTVPDSRLLMIARGLEQGKERVLAEFHSHGIDSGRLVLMGAQPFDRYLALHNQLDIHLDTFPYTGGTVTCHCLWMGVPVVTVTGNAVTSRNGASILGALGLDNLVAHSRDDYVDIAKGLAGDPKRLQDLRSGMRKRMRASSVMNPGQVTDSLEKAYKSIWEKWCRERHSTH